MTAYNRETDLLTSERTPQAAGLFLLLIGLSGLFEYHYAPERAEQFLPFYGIQASLCAMLLTLSAPLRRSGWLQLGSIAVWSLIGASINAYGLVAGVQPELTAVANVIFVTAISMMMPWGMRGQAAVCTLGLAGFALLLLQGEARAVPAPYLFFAVAGSCVLSIVGARSLELHRYAIFRESTDREEEAAMNAALLRVGTTMNSSLDDSDVLDRIAETARRALALDWAVVLLWDERREAFRIAGGASVWDEPLDAARTLEIPPETAPLVQRVLDAHYVEITGDELETMLNPATSGHLRRWGVRALLATTLIRGGRVLGLLAAGSGKPLPEHSTGLRPLFQGISQHVAIALDNVRLVTNLRQADRLKSDFVATMSHELRTPMNVILGYSDLFLDGAFGTLTGEQSYTMQRLHDSARSLLDLINATLEVNRLEAGRSSVEPIDFALDDLLGEIERDCEDIPRAQGVALNWHRDDDAVLVRTDRRKVKIIVKNLVGNALKFTSEGEVRVRTGYERSGERIEVRVADTGSGIRQEDLPEIFGMFRQAEGGQLRGGVGLGLYIVSRFVEQLGGRIDVQSEVGRGSVFTVLLPAEFRAHESTEPLAAAG